MYPFTTIHSHVKMQRQSCNILHTRPWLWLNDAARWQHELVKHDAVSSDDAVSKCIMLSSDAYAHACRTTSYGQGLHFNIKTIFPGMIILVRWHLYIDKVPRRQCHWNTEPRGNSTIINQKNVLMVKCKGEVTPVQLRWSYFPFPLIYWMNASRTCLK